MNDIVGLDLGGSKLLLYSNHDGELIEDIKPTGPNYTQEQFRKDTTEFLAKLSYKPKAIGAAVPGLVENENHIIISNVIRGLAGLDANTLIENNVNSIPVYFINDIRAATVYEATKVGPESVVLVIIIGTGLAAGLIHKGTIITGAGGYAGEIGEMPIQTDSGIVILQELCGGRKILDDANVDGETFHKLLLQKDENAIKILEKAAYYFGLGLTTLLQLYNPDYVILGGSTIKYPGYIEKAKEVVEKYALEASKEHVQYIIPEDNKHEVIFGAMQFALNHL